MSCADWSEAARETSPHVSIFLRQPASKQGWIRLSNSLAVMEYYVAVALIKGTDELLPRGLQWRKTREAL
jgi:hypothetical protein